MSDGRAPDPWSTWPSPSRQSRMSVEPEVFGTIYLLSDVVASGCFAAITANSWCPERLLIFASTVYSLR